MVKAQDVNKLRQQTGAGMMDCKKALVEAEGDFGRAIEVLRKKGKELFASRAGRSTSEGTVWIKINDQANYGVIVALSCETDFVAKNEIFHQLGETILSVAFTHRPASIAALLKLKTDQFSLQERITELVGKIGEKIMVSHYASLSSENVASYIHLGNKLGVLVGLEGRHSSQAVEAAKNVAMQVAAMNPLAIDKESVDAGIVDQELAIAKEQARRAGKPEVMLDKIAQGRLSKFFRERTLLGQAYIKDNEITIAQYLDSVDPGLTVTDFKRVELS